MQHGNFTVRRNSANCTVTTFNTFITLSEQLNDFSRRLQENGTRFKVKFTQKSHIINFYSS